MDNNFSKEHVKLYKSKKKWVAATIFTTSLGISGVSLIESVYANNVNEGSTSINQATISDASQLQSSDTFSNSVLLRSSQRSNLNSKISSNSSLSEDDLLTQSNLSTAGENYVNSKNKGSNSNVPFENDTDSLNPSNEKSPAAKQADKVSNELNGASNDQSSTAKQTDKVSNELNGVSNDQPSTAKQTDKVSNKLNVAPNDQSSDAKQTDKISNKLNSNLEKSSSSNLKPAFYDIPADPMATQNSTAKHWQQENANTYNDGLSQKIDQEAQQNAVVFQKQLSDSKALATYNKLNDMGKRIAQAANLNLSNLSESEIEALNKVRVDGETYDGQLTYSQYKQCGKTLINEDKQFAIPKFDSSKIENFPAATTKDAQSGKTENLDIWDSWPVVQANNGVPVNYKGYQLVIGMMGNGQDWNDGHLYLLYNKYGDNNFDDWKCAGPIFGFNASDKHQQWSGSATLNSDNSIQLYYTEDDLTDGNNHQQLATATIHLNCDDNGVTIGNVTNRKILFAGDGYYYQTYQQWKDANDKMDDFCLRDPHVFEQNGKRYLVFEAGTGSYNYQSNDQVYNLHNYGESTIAEDIQDLFSIINNENMIHKASLANACIGLMELGGTEENPTIAKLYAPIVSTPMVSDEIERPVTVKIGDKYYLFTDTRLNRGIDDSLNNEANKKIGDNVGMLGFVADSFDGDYKPLNGSGVVLTATVPNHDRTSEYSWYAVPMLDSKCNTTNYILITAYMSNRNQAAGKGLNATWGPSYVVKINPNDTTEVIGNSVTAQQGVWIAPIVTTDSHMAIQSQENDNAVQVNENGKWYLREDGKNLTGFQYIKEQNKTVYYDPENGQMLYGQQKINGDWYDFDVVTGAMKFGYQWIADQNKEVYYNPVTGSMVYGQQNINGKWQYFDTVTGAQVKSQYMWIANQNKEVYYDGLGNMVYGQQKIDGKWQYFDTATGAQAKSQYVWIADQNKKVYYDGLGNMVYGQQKINGKWQYFDTVTGAQAQSQYVWIADQNKEVYYDNEGNMVYGWQTIADQDQYFNPITGALETAYNNGLIQKIDQEAQQNAAVFQKQLSDSKAMTTYNKLNNMGKKIAQAANLNLSTLSDSEITALNKLQVTGVTYNGQLTYGAYQQFGRNMLNENQQFAIPKFDKSKIKNFPAAMTKDAQTGENESLDIWDSWPVIDAKNGAPVNYHGYELVVGMMGVPQSGDDAHLYLLYTKYGDNNFNDWKNAGPIFGFKATKDHQQWSGSTVVNSDGSLQLYYTPFDSDNQHIATATIYLDCDSNGIKINRIANQKVLFNGDGYYYQTFQQFKDAKDKVDDFCLRDPHVFEQDGKRYLMFEANTGTFNYQSSSQIYNLSNYGENTIAQDVQDLFSIINNKDVAHRASLANGCIGLMELGGTEENPTIAKLYAPVVSTPMVSDEIERPVTVKIGSKYYLFTDTRVNHGTDIQLTDEIDKKIGDNVGMLGFVADSFDGNYKPLNGSGTVLTCDVPWGDRTSEYSWYAVPMLDSKGNTTNYILITAYMSNRGQAAGKDLNATWGPSYVVKINPNDTTEVIGDSVTAQQGVWVAPVVTTDSHMAIQSQENDNAVQVKENGKWYLREDGKNLTGFQYIKEQNKTVYYNPENGQMLYGQQKINGYWYDFDTVTGAMKFGYQWIADQNKEVYYNPVTGSMVYGQQNINGRWQYFDTVTGAQAKNQYVWIADQNKEVYYDGLGNMVYGQQSINGKWQYFDTVTGAQAKNQYVWIADQNKEVYYDGLGNMVYGQQRINGKWQYFDTITGAQVKNQTIKIDGKFYKFDYLGNLVNLKES